MADARGSEDRALTISVVIVRTVVIPAVRCKKVPLVYLTKHIYSSETKEYFSQWETLNGMVSDFPNGI